MTIAVSDLQPRNASGLVVGVTNCHEQVLFEVMILLREKGAVTAHVDEQRAND